MANKSKGKKGYMSRDFEEIEQLTAEKASKKEAPAKKPKSGKKGSSYNSEAVQLALSKLSK